MKTYYIKCVYENRQAPNMPDGVMENIPHIDSNFKKWTAVYENPLNNVVVEIFLEDDDDINNYDTADCTLIDESEFNTLKQQYLVGQ